MAELAAEAARSLRMREKDILSLRLLRRSVDAREEVRLVYTVEVAVKEESAILRRARSRKISRAAQAPAYTPPSPLPAPAVPPVVVGAGPAGLFAALVLAQAGLRPILLERGRPVERRKADVERFWATGELDLTSNVQFGEGGAGAFSDGKLNTGTRDPRHRFILETLLSCGAPEDILIDAKPHVGTDYLHTVLVNLRRRLLELGTDIRFESRLADLDIRDGALRASPRRGRRAFIPFPAPTCSSAQGTPPGTPSPCSIKGVCPWRPSPSPWGCGSNTGRRTATPPNTGSTPGIPGFRCLPTSSPAICPAAGRPTPSASAPAGRWWRPLLRRSGWSPTA